MPHEVHSPYEQVVLDIIEHSPVGAVPHIPTYQDALTRLHAAHQVYADADHKDGHVTARSLARRPAFHAENLEALGTGALGPEALESNAAIYGRYVASLPEALRPKAEGWRANVVGRTVLHRHKLGPGAHDPLHSLFLVPGSGPHPGLPGNYLHGSVHQLNGTGPSHEIVLHDCDDGVTRFEAASLAEALAKLQEVLESAPFHMSELEALGFKSG